jgi:hypothetical protein
MVNIYLKPKQMVACRTGLETEETADKFCVGKVI